MVLFELNALTKTAMESQFNVQELTSLPEGGAEDPRLHQSPDSHRP